MLRSPGRDLSEKLPGNRVVEKKKKARVRFIVFRSVFILVIALFEGQLFISANLLS